MKGSDAANFLIFSVLPGVFMSVQQMPGGRGTIAKQKPFRLAHAWCATAAEFAIAGRE
jgi:hypothetical protein